MLNKRGVVSITTFSLIILIILVILGFSYGYYTDSKLEVNLIVKEHELQNSLGSFRGELINLIAYKNSNLTYVNNLDSQEIEIRLTNTSITGVTVFANNIVETNISTLGIEFCNSYTFYPSSQTIFSYNGSCISIP